MSAYDPPTNPSSTTFNTSNWSAGSDTTLTQALGDARYLKLKGGNELGPVYFQSHVYTNAVNPITSNHEIVVGYNASDVNIPTTLIVDTDTLYVDSSNNRVGVGTASPSVPLDVVGQCKISGNTAIDTNTLFVDATNNRVGVGTTSPSVVLDVVGETKISGNTAIDTDVFFVDTASNYVGINTATPSVALDVVGAGKFSGNVAVSANTTANTLFVDTTNNRVGVKCVPGVSFDVSGSIRNDDNCNLGDGILYVLKSANSVGINDTSPSYSLDVAGTIRATSTLRTDGTLLVTGNAAFDTNVLYVDALNNKVGIKDSTPSYELDVAGDIRATGDIYGGVIKLATANTTAGGYQYEFSDFSTWSSQVREISILLKSVSLNATANAVIQLGTSGGYATSGYVGSTYGNNGAATYDWSAGVPLWNNMPCTAGQSFNGVVKLYYHNNDDWVATSHVSDTSASTPYVAIGAGYVNFTSDVTKVRLYSGNDGIEFDSCLVNINYA